MDESTEPTQLLIVGLTGGIGAGKSTVTALLGDHGAASVDVDALGHEVIAPNGEAVEALVAHFGEDVRDAAGGINRAQLAARAFADDDSHQALNAICHPAIDRLIDREVDAIVSQLGGPHTSACLQPADLLLSVVLLDMAVLAESTLGRDNRHPYEVVVTVEAPEAVRLERLVARGLSAADAKARMARQATDEQRRSLAHFIVGNGGTLDELAPSVDELAAQLAALARQLTSPHPQPANQP